MSRSESKSFQCVIIINIIMPYTPLHKIVHFNTYNLDPLFTQQCIVIVELEKDGKLTLSAKLLKSHPHKAYPQIL